MAAPPQLSIYVLSTLHARDLWLPFYIPNAYLPFQASTPLLPDFSYPKICYLVPHASSLSC